MLIVVNAMWGSSNWVIELENNSAARSSAIQGDGEKAKVHKPSLHNKCTF